jgi:hypothetical protein
MNFNKYLVRVAASAAILLAGAQSYAGTNSRAFYVNNNGSDAAAGTKGKPLRSIDKINGLHLDAGDTVYFQAGQTFNGTLLLTQGVAGTTARPVVITSFGPGYATINAKDSTAIKIYQGAHIKLQRLKLAGSGRKTGNTKDGLFIINSKEINVEDLNISGFQKSGLNIYSSQNITANHVFAHDNGSAGITVEGPYAKTESRDIRILNCRAENNPGDPANLTNHSGNGIVVGNCRKVLIDHCTATNNGWDMPRTGNGPVGIWAYEADSVIIQHCLSYENKTSKGGADGGGYDLDGGVTNSVVQFCMSYGNQGSGYCIFQYWGATAWHHNVFRYNISEDDGTVSDSQAGLYVWNSSDDEKQFYDCDVYGNIIYNSKVAAVCFSDKSESKGMRFYSNIFVGRDSLIKGKDKIGDARFWGNNWWSIEKGFNADGMSDIKAWAEKTGREMKDGKMTGLNIEPEFKSAGNTKITSASQLKSFGSYQLLESSPLRNKPIFTGPYGIGKIKL